MNKIEQVKAEIKLLQQEKNELKAELKELESLPFDWSLVRFATFVRFKGNKRSGRFVCFENDTIVWLSMFDGLMVSDPADMSIQDPNEFHDIDYVDGITI